MLVSEFRAFVEATDFGDPGWWAGRAPDAPEAWRAQTRHPNRPVVNVNWFQARAFCRWAGRSWRLPVPGGAVDLPTSPEWEVAARGPGGHPFPWGREEPGKEDGARAAHDWGGGPFSDAVPVGAFPLGTSPTGLLDMAGNVWEWCTSVWRQGQESVVTIVDNEGVASSSEARVLRGGAWYYVPRDLRCACRLGFHPRLGNRVFGFRVVCRRAPQHV